MMDVRDLYQELILDHNKRPRNRGKLAAPDRQCDGYNPLCGDRVTVFVKVNDGVVEDISFEGSGCAISTASASLMTECVKGKRVAEAQALFERFRGMVTGAAGSDATGDSLGKLEAFSGVARYPARVKCATLVWHTLSGALGNNSDPVSTE